MTTEPRTLDDALLAREIVTTLSDPNYVPVLVDGVVKLITSANLNLDVVSSYIEDTIANGVTTKAPSQNAVFDALALKADLASPALTGTPTAPTATGGTNTTQIATTAFVQTAITALSSVYAAVAGATFTGTVTLSSTAPTFILYESDAAADEKNWRILATGGDLFIGGFNDAVTVGFSAIAMTRSGTTVDSIAFTATALTFNTVAIPTISSSDTLSNKTIAAPTFTGVSLFSSTAPDIRLYESDAGTNAKYWWHYTDAGVYNLHLVNDAFSVSNVVYSISRTAHTAATFTFSSLTSAIFSGAATFSSTVAINGGTVTLGSSVNVSGGRAAFSSSDLYALAVRYNTSGGHIYFGATNSATPDGYISNNSGSSIAIFKHDRTTELAGRLYGPGVTLSSGSLDVASATDGILWYNGSGSYRWIGGVRSDITGNTNDFILYNSSQGTVMQAYHSTGNVEFYDSLIAQAFVAAGSNGLWRANAGDAYFDSGAVSGTGSFIWRTGTGFSTLLTLATGGMVLGAATGGAKGAGTLNAVGVYDDNTLLTDLVLDFAHTGEWNKKAYANHPIAAVLEDWWFDLDAYEEYWRNERHLPGMISWLDEKSRPSTGAQLTRLTAAVETQAVLISRLKAEIRELKETVH